MSLAAIIAELQRYDRTLHIVPGFGAPHSWRGDYSECAFNPTTSATVGEMLAHCGEAMLGTFVGWKGGEYEFYDHTACHIAEAKDIGEPIGALTVRLMCEHAKLVRIKEVAKAFVEKNHARRRAYCDTSVASGGLAAAMDAADRALADLHLALEEPA